MARRRTRAASGGKLIPALAVALSLTLNPSLPVFGGGPLTNLAAGDGAVTNASAHVAWSLMVPLAGERIGGRRGLWIAGLSWIVLTLVQESLFHAPPNPSPAYPSEVRTDLATRILPCATLLVWDLLRRP